MDLSRLLPARLFGHRPLVPVLRLEGTIGAGGRPGRGLSDAGLAPLIEAAFRKRPAAVALAINSPGGAPAQTALIAARIRRLAQETDTPVHAFVEDIAASGGYWLACAADHIWADETSVVGSIGVISAGFGLHEFIARHGIERRVHTAGQSKSFLDPFRPERPEDVARLEALLGPLHRSFREYVIARRGVRLAPGRDLFTGDIWVGSEAVPLGLVDGLAHLVPKMTELYGPKVRFQPFVRKRPFLSRFGLSLAEDTIAALEERAGFARFGL